MAEKTIPRRAVILGLVFLLLGLAWAVSIYWRCTRISPKPMKVPASYTELERDIRATVRYHVIHSPYVKPYHVICFLAVAGLELVCCFFYIFSGIAVLRWYPLVKMWVWGTLVLDVVFKLLVAAYMQFCAVPLAALTKNKNILVSYYMPDSSVWSQISLYLSGLKVFEPAGWPYIFLYLFYFQVCFTSIPKLQKT
jgi:hypothetical protein